MRPAPTIFASLTSLALLGTLAGCSSPVASPPPATPDAATPTDSAAPADTPAPEDVAPPEDTYIDVPVVVDPDAPPPPPEDAAAPPDATAQPDVTTRPDVATDRGADAVVDPPADGGFTPGSCGVSPDVRAFVTELSTTGWAAVNRSRSMLMHGCAGASRPQDCLASVPEADASNLGANVSAVEGARLRVLFTSPSRSTYWTRSSADGRFVARGTRIVDLQRGAEITAMGASYDPAFFPDNSGYMYQPGGRLCPMSTLTTGMPTTVAITGSGSPCSGSSVGLYEHLAASLGGGDYWATSAGTAAWDDGGGRVTLTETRRNETWGPSAQVALSLMANTGSGFRFLATRNVGTPYQGDAVISPSTGALITRYVDSAGAYQGYVLHRLTATPSGSAITASIREIARYCTVGAKPAFSYDERWVVYHHYIGGGPSANADAMERGFTGASDPGFAQYASRGAADIYLLDLQTGRRTRVTRMGPGKYALFPHFRSDGWIYFLVRSPDTPREHVVASDAAFVLR